MSSWANRHIPRKRDLSKVPDAFRPQIVSRVEQPSVVLSETFQKVHNEIIYPSEPKGRSASQTSIPSANSSATELRYNGASYIFVILRHLRTSRDNELWIASYQSIRTFYTNKIIIIDDNSSVNTVNGKLVNTEVIVSDWNGAGEVLPYYYFLQYRWADRMIFLHDSMFLNRPFRDSELRDPLRFHWYTDRNSKEESTLPTYLSLLYDQSKLTKYALGSTWRGCFGGASIISLDTVQSLEEKYGLFSKLVMMIRTKVDRDMFSRILGVVLFYDGILDETNCSNFGTISAYPGAFEYYTANPQVAAYELSQKGYDSAILTVWRGL